MFKSVLRVEAKSSPIPTHGFDYAKWLESIDEDDEVVYLTPAPAEINNSDHDTEEDQPTQSTEEEEEEDVSFYSQNSSSNSSASIHDSIENMIEDLRDFNSGHPLHPWEGFRARRSSRHVRRPDSYRE